MAPIESRRSHNRRTSSTISIRVLAWSGLKIMPMATTFSADVTSVGICHGNQFLLLQVTSWPIGEF